MDARNLVPALLALLLPSLASAQESETQIAQATATANVLNNSGTNNFFSGPSSILNLEIGKDNKTISGKFGAWRFSNRLAASLELKTPFDKEAGSGSPVNLDGLAGATTATLGLDYIRVDVRESDTDASFARQLCGKYLLMNDSLASCDVADVEEQALAFFETLDALQKGLRCGQLSLAADECTKERFAARWVEEYDQEGQQYFGPATSAWIAPFKVTYGEQALKFIDAQSFTAGKLSTEPYAVSLGIGKVSFGSFIGAGIERQKRYEEKPTAEICLPSSATPTTLVCNSGPLGAPTEINQTNLFLEYRYRKVGSAMAYGFKYTRDTTQDEDMVEFPVYFAGDNAFGLNTGVRLGWTSMDDEVTFQFFIGKSFQYFDR